MIIELKSTDIFNGMLGERYIYNRGVCVFECVSICIHMYFAKWSI